MDKKHEDTKVSIGNKMMLEIKEARGTSTMYSSKEDFDEVSKETRTSFYWKLHGVASKIGMDVVESDDFDPKEQEVYDVVITSHGFDHGCFSGFNSREKAIQNALEFATRNGIDVDGYKAKAEKE